MLARLPRRLLSCSMSRANKRAQMFSAHISSVSANSLRENQPVAFEQNSRLRKFILNRGAKANALNGEMIDLLRPQIEKWKHDRLCHVIVGTSQYPGRAKVFCAGGDVAAIVKHLEDESTRHLATDYFKKEFDLDYLLSTTTKSYVAIMDGITMGGGFGLVAPAGFRVATENTRLAMPETKIGYFPDVGSNFYLNRLDGYLGAYLAVTGIEVNGRTAFEIGLATHYIPSARLPALYDQLTEAKNTHEVNLVLEGFTESADPGEATWALGGPVREAIDDAFSQETAEAIIERLRLLEGVKNTNVAKWARDTRNLLDTRSPTSLKVALKAFQGAKHLTTSDYQRSLKAVFHMEMKIVEAYCRGVSPDFVHGVTQSLILRTDERRWSPDKLQDVTEDMIAPFFQGESFLDLTENLEPRDRDEANIDIEAQWETVIFERFALPSEWEIESVIRGSHPSSGSSGMTIHDVKVKFNDLKDNKIGMETKIDEVVMRKCTLVDNGDGNQVWLRWGDGGGKEPSVPESDSPEDSSGNEK